MLSNGVVVSYLGAAQNDPGGCLSSWNGRTRKFLLGVLPKGRGHRSHADEREAIRTTLLGPPGTQAEFEDRDATLWGRVTVEHVADPTLQLSSGPRRTVQLRVIRHDEHGRPDVRQIMLYWVDVRSGIVLKAQVVTEMDSGERFATDVWRIERLG